MNAPATIALSLISHTNVGKTTLARTLLGIDVGEVRDAAHVTLESAAYTMLVTPAGERLELWDTPGFGDSARLARRLEQHGQPIGWFLTQVWDRFRDRPLWLSQQAVRNVRDEADAVLYLVNAAEDPADAGYLAAELRVLEWIGKPVVMILNQTGVPRPAEVEAAEAARWQRMVADSSCVRAVIPLDAFTRCWVQEITLLRTIAPLLPERRRELLLRLAEAWRARRMGQFRAAMRLLAQPIAAAAVDRIVVRDSAWRGTLQRVGRAMGLGTTRETATDAALQTLGGRLADAIQASTDALISLHGIEGHAAREVGAKLAGAVTTVAPADEGRAAVVGGVLSGALSGLAADLATGGLSFGAGMLAGSVLGALGGAGIARGYNLVRGTTETTLCWSEEFLAGLVRGALLRYLAVAHFGRGRGEWSAGEPPVFWRERIDEILTDRADALARLWATRSTASADALAEALEPELAGAALALLDAFYPGTLGSHDTAVAA